MNIRRYCSVAVVASCLGSRPLAAQWSIAPTIAVGAAIPGGVLRDRVSEGPTVKVGLWIRAPKLPVGITTEAMYAHFLPGGVDRAADGLRVGALSVNVTTRRHDRRFDLYGVAGAGWYWHSGANGKYTDRQAPGFSVGIGEVFRVAAVDSFFEVRLHRVHTPSRAGESWMTLMPFVVGARF